MSLTNTLRYHFLLAVALLTLPAAAQTVDLTFTAADVRADQNTPRSIGQIVVDAQGRKLIAGQFDFVQRTRRGNVARLLPDGTLDASFNPGGAGTNSEVTAVVALPNGQWLVGGSFTRYNGVVTGPLLRLNADGTLDPTFAPTTLYDRKVVQALTIDSQSRVVVLADRLPYVPSYYTDEQAELLRLLPTGAPDPSFQPASGQWVGTMVAVDAADRILVNRTSGMQFEPAVLTRLLPSGAPDPSFLSGASGLNSPVRQLLFQPDGRLLVSGELPFFYNGTYVPSSIVRLHPDGTLDTSFSALFSYPVTAIALSPAGKLMICHHAEDSTHNKRELIERRLPNGALDSTFAAPSFPSDNSSYWRALAIEPTGDVLVGTSGELPSNQAPRTMIRLLPNGALDPAFVDPAPDRHGAVRELARQSGDRLLAIGDFDRVNGQATPYIARFSADGALDSSFQPDTTLLQCLVYNGVNPAAPVVVVDAADRLLVNSMSSYGAIRRFLPDGHTDPTFYVGQGATGSFFPMGFYPTTSCLAIQPDGRILIGGNFTAYHGVPRQHIVRLLPDGHVDPSFVAPLSMPPLVSQLSCLPDGRVQALVTVGWGGPQVVTLDSTGTLLSVVADSATSYEFSSLTFLPDGSYFSNGGSPLTVVKFTSAGTVDPTFTLDPALAGEALTLVPQPDGRLLVRSNPYPVSSASNEINALRPLRRLLPDGSLDASFQPLELGAGRDWLTYGPLLFQSTGDLVIGGSFTTVGDQTGYPSLVRLANVVTGLPASAGASSVGSLDVFPNPARASLTLRRPLATGATATLFDVLGRPVRHWSLTAAEQRVPLTGVPAGAYVVRVVSAAGVATRRVVVAE